jgi:hypothetical protein
VDGEGAGGERLAQAAVVGHGGEAGRARWPVVQRTD